MSTRFRSSAICSIMVIASSGALAAGGGSGREDGMSAPGSLPERSKKRGMLDGSGMRASAPGGRLGKDDGTAHRHVEGLHRRVHGNGQILHGPIGKQILRNTTPFVTQHDETRAV